MIATYILEAIIYLYFVMFHIQWFIWKTQHVLAVYYFYSFAVSFDFTPNNYGRKVFQRKP